MDRREQSTLNFYIPDVPKVKGDRQYQRPTLPTDKHLSSSQKRQLHMNQTRSYIRMFCGSLCTFSFLMLISTSPLNWVQFLVTKSGLELYAGLWTLCNHELCWNHTPKPPYYLQYSRAFFIISILIILINLGLLFNSCLPGRASKISNLDPKVSMLSFISAVFLLLCLNLFLAQVRWHTRNVMESAFLWTYHMNWWCDFLYVCAGILSFLNYVTFKYVPPGISSTVTPIERSRLGIGPVSTTFWPAEDEMTRSNMKSLSERKLPNAGLE
uniref:Transmembrane protein 202 n=1 Tax=Sciurus vulgaris TaxID=55149 RepID=A0A8D2JIC0_SCIVU